MNPLVWHCSKKYRRKQEDNGYTPDPQNALRTASASGPCSIPVARFTSWACSSFREGCRRRPRKRNWPFPIRKRPVSLLSRRMEALGAELEAHEALHLDRRRPRQSRAHSSMSLARTQSAALPSAVFAALLIMPRIIPHPPPIMCAENSFLARSIWERNAGFVCRLE